MFNDKKLKEYPQEIIDLAYHYHKHKGANPYETNYSRIDDCLEAKPESLFIFDKTSEGHRFWADIFFNNDIDVFYDKYPKQSIK